MIDTRPGVLIVDDRPDNLLALEAVLAPLDARIVRAGSGEEALRYLLSEECAVILLDVQMPGMDGFETARMIKGRPRTRAVPIIFLTAIDRDMEHHLAGYASGAVDYLAKPFLPEVLRAKVSVFVELYRGAKLIEAQNELLAQRLAELDRTRAALAREAQQLERSNAALERFAFIVAHEIREPVLILSGLRELLAGPPDGRTVGLVPSEASEVVSRMGAELVSMTVLLDRLLAYSSVSSGELNLRSLALEEILAHAENELSAQIGEANAIVSHDPLPSVTGDEWQLEQVFVHLIANAVKYKGTTNPHVHVGLTRQNDDWVFSVADNGIGIPPSELPRLFTVFSRPAPQPAGHGPGLGLAIVRRAVEHHGGHVWAQSTPGRGTTVSFSLPVGTTEGASV
jgi:signal transduction histidine kinase